MQPEIGSDLLRQSVADAYAQAAAAVNAELPGADARLPNSILDALCAMVAGAQEINQGMLEALAETWLPDRATGPILEAHASWRGVFRKAASYAFGGVEFSGAAGAAIPAGTQWRRSDGAVYELQPDGVIIGAGGTGVGRVEAADPGSAANSLPGTALAIMTRIAGIGATATVEDGGLTGGSDDESDDDLRARLRAAIRRPCGGGTADDWARWTLEVPGVDQAWVAAAYPGLGIVSVWFTVEEDAAHPDGTPLPGDVSRVYDYLTDPSRLPVTATVWVGAPTPHPVNFVVSALNPDTPEVRAAIEAELRDLIARERSATGYTLLVSHFREAVSIAPGEFDHVPTAPAANMIFAIGRLPVFGSVTFS